MFRWMRARELRMERSPTCVKGCHRWSDAQSPVVRVLYLPLKVYGCDRLQAAEDVCSGKLFGSGFLPRHRKAFLVGTATIEPRGEQHEGRLSNKDLARLHAASYRSIASRERNLQRPIPGHRFLT